LEQFHTEQSFFVSRTLNITIRETQGYTGEREKKLYDWLKLEHYIYSLQEIKINCHNHKEGKEDDVIINIMSYKQAITEYWPSMLYLLEIWYSWECELVHIHTPIYSIKSLYYINIEVTIIQIKNCRVKRWLANCIDDGIIYINHVTMTCTPMWMNLNSLNSNFLSISLNLLYLSH